MFAKRVYCLVIESLIICKEILRDFFRVDDFLNHCLKMNICLFISWKRSRASVQQLD